MNKKQSVSGCLDCLHPICDNHWDRYEECVRQRSRALIALSNMLPLYNYYRQRDQFENWVNTSKEACDMRAIYESMLLEFIESHEAVIDAAEDEGR